MSRRAPGLALLFALAGACSEPQTTTVVGGDGRFALTVPPGWKPATFESPAPLKLGRMFSSGFAQLASDAKVDLTLTTIEAYAERCERAIAAKSLLEGREQTELSALTVGSLHGLQREVRGTVKDVRMVFWHAYVETPNRWVAFQCWAAVSNFPDVRSECAKMLATVREAAPGEAPSAPE